MVEACQLKSSFGSPLVIDQEVRLEYLVEKRMWHSLERRHQDQFSVVTSKAVKDIRIHIQIHLLG